MKKYPRFSFWLIVVLTILSVIIDLPKNIPISITTPQLPLINKKISINRTLHGFSPDFAIGNTRITRSFEFKKGLDLEGGTSITLKADMKTIPQDQRNTALESTKNVIEQRVNFFGVSEPLIQTAISNDEYRLIVELPGITNIDEAIKLVGTTAQLEFRNLLPEATRSAYLQYEMTSDIGLSGADLKDAQASYSQQNGEPVVLFRVVEKSQKKFQDTTKKLVGKRMAICLDKQCFSAPTVNEAIRDNGQISGGFTIDQARQLALQLNAGALPTPLSILEQRTIGPTLGAQSIQKSLFAGAIGIAVIILFMVVLYGKLGVIASIALVLYTLFTLALFKIIPVTLTLAGIAGFILSIGMAVDANILIFERLKEELRRNKPKEIAIELGFSRAWSSIRDSNISSIITCAILFAFGSGAVRGFAVTLFLGVMVSMFSAIIVTRTFLRMMNR